MVTVEGGKGPKRAQRAPSRQCWMVLEPTRLAMLDHGPVVRMNPWPQLGVELFARGPAVLTTWPSRSRSPITNGRVCKEQTHQDGDPALGQGFREPSVGLEPTTLPYHGKSCHPMTPNAAHVSDDERLAGISGFARHSWSSFYAEWRELSESGDGFAKHVEHDLALC